MSRYKGMVYVGDVLVTREGPWYVSMAIRLGAFLMHRPSVCNHVIIVHHMDANDIMWGIEGRPGGVGWRDLSGPLSNRYTNANNQQPKTDDQRYLIATAAESLLAVGYDWEAIAADAAHVIAINRIWLKVERNYEWKDGEVPGHVVCSAFADWCYEQVGLANPGGPQVTRFTTPGDWDAFMMREEWDNVTYE